MITVRVEKQDDKFLVFDNNGQLLETFNYGDNLQRALELLKQFNSIKTTDGLPVYQTRVFQGVSVWSFHQNVLFWNFLWNYARYETIIKFLFEKKVDIITAVNNVGDLANYLRLSGIKVIGTASNSKARLPILQSWIYRVFRVIGLALTFLAFLKLLIGRHAVLVYTPDKFSEKYGCDFRFSPVYEYLRERKIRFVEVFHTLLGNEFFDNVLKRKRVALYLECLPTCSRYEVSLTKYNLDAIEPHHRKYFLHLLDTVDRHSQLSIRRIRTLARLLKFTNVKVLLAIDDARYTNELIVACRLNGVKAYGFQHGHFTKYHTGWMNYGIPKELSVTFDKLFVWNEYWKRVLLSQSTQYDESNVEVGGTLRELELINYTRKNSRLQKLPDLHILVPYEAVAPKTEIGAYIDRFIEQGIRVSFKLRPDSPPESQLAQYHINHADKVALVEQVDEKVLSRIDAVAGVYSTFLNEMLFYNKPVFLLKTSLDLGHQLVDDSLALPISLKTDMSAMLDYINNYQSKNAQVWPPTNRRLTETLDWCLS